MYKEIIIILVIISGLVFPQNNYNSRIQDLEVKLSQVNGTTKVDVLNELSFYSYRESTQKGIYYSSQALSLAYSINYVKGQAIALDRRGFGYYIMNKMDSAKMLYQKAFPIIEKEQILKEKTSWLNNFGLICWREGEINKALDNYRNAQKLAIRINDSAEVARSLNYIGLVYWKWGDFSRALEYFSQALKIKDKLQDDFEIATSLNNIASTYNDLKEYQESLKYSNKALKIAEQINDKYGIGRALNLIGVSQYKLRNFSKAKEIQFRSLAIKQASGDKSGVGYSYSSIGDIFFELKNYNKAQGYYNNSLAIRKELKDYYGISSVMIKLGQVYVKLNNLDLAKNYYLQSLEIAKKERLKDVEKNCYLSISNLYEIKKDYKQSFFYYKLYDQLSDSIWNKENRDKLAELKINFESDSKEKEIALLTKEKELDQLQLSRQAQRYNILIIFSLFCLLMTVTYFYFQNRRKLLLEEKNKNMEKYNDELRELNASKDKFFSIVAHDLKSPFQGLLGFSNLLCNDLDSLSREQIKHYADNIRISTRNVYELIENLLDWSRIQVGRFEFAPDEFTLNTEAQKVVTLLHGNASKKGITISNTIPQDIIVKADHKMLHCIFQNLLSNAIKFTNANGQIVLSAESSGKMINIKIADDGVGIKKEDIVKIFKIDTQFTTTGTAQEKGTGLGLLLCKEMVEKHGGSIDVESEPGKGSVFYFTLPV